MKTAVSIIAAILIGTLGFVAYNTANDVTLGAMPGTDVYQKMTFYEPVSTREFVLYPLASSTVSALNSGATIYQGADAVGDLGLTLTLPPVSAKAHYTFAVGAAFGTDNFIIDSAEGDNIEGTLIVAGAVVDCDGEDQINFIADGENIGDFVELFSNGTNWIIGASGGLTSAKITCTDPS